MAQRIGYPGAMAVGAKTAMTSLGVCLVAAVVFLHPAPGLDAPLTTDVRNARSDPEPVHLAVGELDAAPLARILAEPARPVDGEPIAYQPPTLEQRRRFGPLVLALRDDDIPGNALEAIGELRDQTEAAGLLYETLHSPDLQQRHLAAWLLRDMPAENSPELAMVSVDALRPEVGRSLYGTILESLSQDATRYLYHRPEHARQPLRIALHSADKQQRFLAAFLLGAAGATEDAATIVRELAPHLCDNDITGDALLATHGLYRLGDVGGRLLVHWRTGLDTQGRQLVDLIQLNLRNPPRNQRELEARRRMHSVTSLCFDPTIDYDVRSAYWEQIR